MTGRLCDPSRLVRIPCSTLNHYEAGATLLSAVTFPEAGADAQRVAAQRAICSTVLRQAANDDEAWAWSVQRMRPGYLTQPECEVRRVMKTVIRRLRHRLIVGGMGGLMLVQQQLKEESPQYRKTSINKMAERFSRFVHQSSAANFKSRVLAPSRPVFHVAMSLNSYSTSLEDISDIPNGILTSTIYDQDFSENIIKDSELLAAMMAEIPELRAISQQLTRFEMA